MSPNTMAYLQLTLTPGVGSITALRMATEAGNSMLATKMTASQIERVNGVGRIRAADIASGLRSSRDEMLRVVQRCQELGVRIYSQIDWGYPLMLAQLFDTPAIIFVRGQFEARDLHAVGIVGSRKCTLYGREQAERFGSQLSQMGVTVVSGGARGVDTAAHKGAMLTSNGRTIAVLGCGVDIAYPPENRGLFDDIVASGRGVLVSELPPGTPPSAENFPRRNRIISGLSRGIVVIEADERSGSLITARQCIEDHNREVFAVPGRLDSPTSAGPHKLIREGATLVTCAADVVEGLGPLPDLEAEEAKRRFIRLSEDLPAGPGPEDDMPLGIIEPAVELAPIVESPKAVEVRPSNAPPLDGDRKIVFEALHQESQSADDVSNATGLEIQVVMRELTMLSMLGLIKRVDGNSYVRK
jgi:DNA processing protein